MIQSGPKTQVDPQRFIVDSDSEEHRNTAKAKREQPLDMHHLYIKEMKEPNYRILNNVGKDQHEKSKVEKDYLKSYLPGGKPIALKSFKD